MCIRTYKIIILSAEEKEKNVHGVKLGKTRRKHRRIITQYNIFMIRTHCMHINIILCTINIVYYYTTTTPIRVCYSIL
jgi:hypothetical protein